VSAEVVLHDGRSVGRELLKEGLAWWQRSTSTNAGFEVIEELAKASGKGLWADSNPVPPWKWKAPKQTSQKSSH
jgi:micrococcal nuclease